MANNIPDDESSFPFMQGLSKADREAVFHIYTKKLLQGELNEISENRRGGKRLQYVAALYKEQKLAFCDILTKEGFEIASEVSKDYDGRIAILTNHGTLILLGKPKPKRIIITKRIHSPQYNYTGQRVELIEDLLIGRTPKIQAHIRFYEHSNARGLAINPRGADSDNLEEKVFETISNAIDALTTDRAMESLRV